MGESGEIASLRPCEKSLVPCRDMQRAAAGSCDSESGCGGITEIVRPVLWQLRVGATYEQIRYEERDEGGKSVSNGYKTDEKGR